MTEHPTIPAYIRPACTSSFSSYSPSSVVDYLLDRLAAAGVRHVFGVPGDYNLALLDAIEQHPDLQWVGSTNELNAAYAADGYARIAGLAALVTTYGVGELSAINGIAGAYAEHVPILHIVGTPTTQVRAHAVPVHHSLLDGDHHHFARAYREVVCAHADLTATDAPKQIDRVLTEVLACKQPGYLAVPADLVNAACPPTPTGAGDDTARHAGLAARLKDAPRFGDLAGHDRERERDWLDRELETERSYATAPAPFPTRPVSAAFAESTPMV